MKWCFITNFYQFSLFMNHEDLSFGGIALKIEFVVFVYDHELIMKLFSITWLCN